MANITNQTAFFKACERGDITTAEGLVRDVNPSSLKEWKTPEERTCLHGAVLAGYPEFLGELAANLLELITTADNQGNTALHLAVRKDLVDLLKQLVLESDAILCDCENKKGETPLKLAISLGFKDAVEFLITRTSNALHMIVELNQLQLLQFLIEKNVDLSKLINQPYQPATNPSDNQGNRATDPQRIQFIVGDTPLHIAARNKYEHMVNLLLSMPSVNKLAYNSEWKTPLDIAREVTEYHESFRIIKQLGDDQAKGKPFMYCVPQVSHEKYTRAMNLANTAFDKRRNSELVAAALLATMTFTAAISMPGGFQTDATQRNELGSPVLMPFTSFKIFMIFDCIAFFLSLFVCIMWQMSSELTIRDKLLFITVNGSVICWSFCFTAYGFIAAMYSLFAHKVKTFGWIVLVNLIFITTCVFFAFIYQSARSTVVRARVHRLLGVPRLEDNFVIWVWETFERLGFLDNLRSWGAWVCVILSGQFNSCGVRIPEKITDLFYAGKCSWKCVVLGKKGEHRNNCSCFSLPCPVYPGISQP